VKVVLDTNVIIAALIARGLCHEVFQRAVRLRVVVTSAPLLDELEATLRRKFQVTPAVAAFLSAFRGQARLVEPVVPRSRVCRDPDDDVVLATAVAAGAAVIVTGDEDLLSLRSYEGVAVLSPRQFLERLDAGPLSDPG
jgi:uncharacterized protein